MAAHYLETCKIAAGAIDVETLAGMLPNKSIGSGKDFVFRPLGVLTVAKASQQCVGLKLFRQRSRAAENRFTRELAFLSVVTQAAPVLTPDIPSFMNLLKVEGSGAATILSQDFSFVGQAEIKRVSASEEARGLIYEAFSEYGPPKDVLNKVACDNTLAYSVDGRERLLDFTPSPIKDNIVYSSGEFKEAMHEVADLLPRITITLPRNSILGQALLSS